MTADVLVDPIVRLLHERREPQTFALSSDHRAAPWHGSEYASLIGSSVPVLHTDHNDITPASTVFQLALFAATSSSRLDPERLRRRHATNVDSASSSVSITMKQSYDLAQRKSDTRARSVYSWRHFAKPSPWIREDRRSEGRSSGFQASSHNTRQSSSWVELCREPDRFEFTIEQPSRFEFLQGATVIKIID